ncbi:hypothetical protein M5K25_000298 [Dendrobium thyrsiflorum]|uniref:Uncharacterized protein n=1 Tax=Dendrobium thyrsiflorum TaxID=117978 RepID=A0ABD0W7D9_DENTH
MLFQARIRVIFSSRRPCSLVALKVSSSAIRLGSLPASGGSKRSQGSLPASGGNKRRSGSLPYQDKKVDVLEERLEWEMNQIKTMMEDRISSMEGQVANLWDIMKKMLEFYNQTTASEARGPEGKNANSKICKEEDEVEIIEGNREDPILSLFRGRVEELKTIQLSMNRGRDSNSLSNPSVFPLGCRKEWTSALTFCASLLAEIRGIGWFETAGSSTLRRHQMGPEARQLEVESDRR